MKVGLIRLGGVLCILAVVLLPNSITWAAPANQEGEINPQECSECHLSTVIAWEGSAHMRALTCSQCHVDGEPIISMDTNHPMQEEDQPSCVSCHTTGYDPLTNTWLDDGVTCQACHDPINPNHPDEPMPIERSAYMCGSCHTETYTEWKLSQHGREDMVCVSCHNPHAGRIKDEEASYLCITCHQPGSENFVHSKHSDFMLTKHNQEELTCADCHLGELNNEPGLGHAFRDHSFHVRLGTCSACHNNQQHMASDMTTTESVAEPTPVVPIEEPSFMSLTPTPVSPIGFILLAILVGLGAGMLIAPVLGRFAKQLNGAIQQANDEDGE